MRFHELGVDHRVGHHHHGAGAIASLNFHHERAGLLAQTVPLASLVLSELVLEPLPAVSPGDVRWLFQISTTPRKCLRWSVCL